MIASLLAALWGVGAEAFCLTVFFVVWILRIALPVATRWLESEPDTVIYFAPWVSWCACRGFFFGDGAGRAVAATATATAPSTTTSTANTTYYTATIH